MNYQKAEFEAAFGTYAQLPPSTVAEIAFAGRSNVGKSSLINKVLNRKALARTSGVPGKTVTINFYKVDGVRFVDLPGYGYAKVPKSEKQRWSEMMEGYFNSGRNLRLVVQLIDMRHPPSRDDIAMMEFLKEAGYPFLIAMTKSDKLKKMEREKRLQALEEELAFVPDVQRIPFSAVNGEGVSKLKERIEAAG